MRQAGSFLLEALVAFFVLVLLMGAVTQVFARVTQFQFGLQQRLQDAAQFRYLHSVLLQALSQAEAVQVTDTQLGVQDQGFWIWFGIYRGRFFRQKSGGNRQYLSDAIFENLSVSASGELIQLQIETQDAAVQEWTFYQRGGL